MSANAREILKSYAYRHLAGDRYVEECDFIATLSDESCAQYLRVIEAQDDLRSFYQ
jgi:hypothetical protein